MIRDLEEKNWNIKLDEKTLIRPRADIAKGQMIKIIGTQLAGDYFQANEIRPWVGMGQGMMGGNSGRGGMMNGGYQGGGMMRGN